ncbi:STAS domain-containing protein [Umezawaea endophytica]|uniref:STAS domain-containing protein n=1 Tax=Umezawaea endophytica TaxID=1654476 RepID=A0A9X2VEZ8_9PSEU|nr:STAS domain-containing protein [Umezawaea endophytica]MCS7475416.1 STAS domain-containing protein [Umezawaea endophytica]
MAREHDETLLVSVARSPGAVVVTVSGEVDADTAPSLDRSLGEVDADSGVVVLDMAAVTFFDSAGLASFLGLIHRGVEFHLVGSRQVVRTVSLAGIDRHVTLVDSVADALGPVSR